MSNEKKNPLVSAASYNNVAKAPNLDGIKKKTVKSENESKVESKNEIKVESKSILDEITDFKKKPKKRAVTVYVDQEVRDALDEVAKAKGKGAISELVEKLLKNTFGIN